jgi:hypothetical protein
MVKDIHLLRLLDVETGTLIEEAERENFGEVKISIEQM